MAEEEIGSKEQAPKSNRILFCYFFIVLLLGLVAIGILVRAFDTAFVERETWMKVAESQKRPNRLIYPSRGNIYSSDGKLMATSVPCFYLYIDFNADCYTHPTKKWNSLDTLLKSKHNGIDSLSFYLSRKLKDRTPAGYKNYLLNGLKKKSRQFPVCDGKVSYSDLKEIKKFPFFRLGRFKSGFYTREMVERQKPFGTLASRTIGDTFRDIDPKTGLTKGKNGLELQYDTLAPRRSRPEFRTPSRWRMDECRRGRSGGRNGYPHDDRHQYPGYSREVVARHAEKDRRCIGYGCCHGSRDRRGESHYQHGAYS